MGDKKDCGCNPKDKDKELRELCENKGITCCQPEILSYDLDKLVEEYAKNNL